MLILIGRVEFFRSADVGSIGFDGDLLIMGGLWMNIFEIITVSVKFIFEEKGVGCVFGGLVAMLPSQILFH